MYYPAQPCCVSSRYRGGHCVRSFIKKHHQHQKKRNKASSAVDCVHCCSRKKPEGMIPLIDGARELLQKNVIVMQYEFSIHSRFLCVISKVRQHISMSHIPTDSNLMAVDNLHFPLTNSPACQLCPLLRQTYYTSMCCGVIIRKKGWLVCVLDSFPSPRTYNISSNL